MLKIVRIKHDPSGEIFAFQLNSGEIKTRQDTVKMVKKGEISGALCGVDENGKETINLLNGANQVDSIDKLPEIEGSIEFIIREMH